MMRFHDSRCAIGSVWLFITFIALHTARSYNTRTTMQGVVQLSNGVLMPAIAFGTGLTGVTDGDLKTTEVAVKMALANGYVHIDTSHDYYNQGAVQIALEGHTNVFVTTKVPGCGFDVVSKEHCASDTALLMRDNLKRLKVPRVDLTLLHNTDVHRDCSRMQAQWKALEDAYRLNLTRAIGLSNYYYTSDIECIISISRVRPMVNQVLYHIGMGADPFGGLWSRLRSYGIAVQAFSPLGGEIHLTKQLLELEEVERIAHNHGKTSAQVALRWVLQNAGSLVTESMNALHQQESLAVYGWELDVREMAKLDTVLLY